MRRFALALPIALAVGLGVAPNASAAAPYYQCYTTAPDGTVTYSPYYYTKEGAKAYVAKEKVTIHLTRAGVASRGFR